MANFCLPAVFAIKEEEQEEADGFFNNVVTRVASVYRGSHSSPLCLGMQGGVDVFLP